MDIRYSASPNDVKRYTTEELRSEFLITNLYQADKVTATYSHVDRMVTFGIMPISEEVSLDKGIDIWANFGTSFLLERREIGFFNIGETGICTVDGIEYIMENKDCIYIAMGTKAVTFKSLDKNKPAKFYGVSAPAHKAYETKLIKIKDAAKKPLGALETANKRVINQFIHPDVLPTCQLLMGLTILETGNVWNT
ncbi:MAG: 5-dehydro-4-deoxy-D-glucuronate isomerase, partial [Defluviitaleaceae bacterium]|nr:5-dehydro-4-deoxy-D-glucuronate isomerase [Defluviitaleaceae bacterium]